MSKSPEEYYKLAELYHYADSEDKESIQNINKAIECYLKCGSKKAYLQLGKIYEIGIYVEQDYNKAIEYYLKAEEEAYMNLGLLYKIHLQEPELSRKYYELARKYFAENNMYNKLGHYYESVEKNFGEAIKYYELDGDNHNSLYRIGMIYYYDFKNFKKIAMDYFIKAEKLGNTDCYTQMIDYLCLHKNIDSNWNLDREIKKIKEYAYKSIQNNNFESNHTFITYARNPDITIIIDEIIKNELLHKQIEEHINYMPKGIKYHKIEQDFQDKYGKSIKKTD